MDEVSLNYKIELLEKTDLFSKLSRSYLEVVARYSSFESFERGDLIFNEGTCREELYIVETGEILILKDQVDEETVDVAKFFPVECFGELDLLGSTPRTATAIAKRKSNLLIFPSKGIEFKDVLEKHPEISARILHELLAIIAGRIRNINSAISEKDPLIAELKKQLMFDKLTGLLNRAFIEEDFVNQLPEYGETTGILMIKPDNFKDVNDNFGHNTGDIVLKQIASLIASELGENNIAIRYRGDEFCAILPGLDIKDSLSIAQSIKNSLKKMDLKEIGDSNFFLTTSIGMSMFPKTSNKPLKLINLAYEKMMDARNCGGDRINE